MEQPRADRIAAFLWFVANIRVTLKLREDRQIYI